MNKQNTSMVNRIGKPFLTFLLVGTVAGSLFLTGMPTDNVRVYAAPDVAVATADELQAAINNPALPQPLIIELTANIDNTDLTTGDTITIPINKAITLTGGKTLTGTDGHATLLVNGTLAIDGIIVTHAAGETGSGVIVNSNGSFTMSQTSDAVSTKITGNTGQYGGGVYNSGTFILTGGEISGNTADTGSGGGVYNQGIFDMSGGKIIGNEAIRLASDPDQTGWGGGICNNSSAANAFTISGGEISRNIASWGGGIMIVYGTLTMTSGQISGNEATPTSGVINPQNSGGGVYVHNNSTFNMSGDAVIAGNKAQYGGGVCTYSYSASYLTTFNMSSGEISGNTAVRTGGGVYNQGTFDMSGGKIIENMAAGGGGVVVATTRGYFSMSGGEISENSATSSGGGVYNNNSFTLIDGKIANNNANIGGGVIAATGIFTMSGGEISGNTAGTHGGGVYVNEWNDSRITTFTLTGGKISDNQATNDGGGVYTINYANFTTSGSDIVFSNNKAQAAYLLDTSSTQYVDYGNYIQHAPKIWTEPFEYGYNNYDINYTNGTSTLLVTFDANGGAFLDTSIAKVIAVSPSGSVGASMPTNPIWAGHNFLKWNTMADGSGDDFTDATTVASSITVYAQWTTSYTVTVNGSYAGTGNTGAGQYTNGMSVTIRAGARAGYTFNGWTVNAGGVILANFNNATTAFTMPDNNVIVTANWRAVVTAPTRTVTATITTAPPVVTSTQTVTATTTATATLATTSTVTTTTTTTAATTFTATATTASTVTSTATETSTTTATITAPCPPPGGSDDGQWALFNLILAITGVLVGLAAIIHSARKEESKYHKGTQTAEYEIGQNQRNLVWLLITVIAAVVGIGFFFYTENMSNPVTFLDKWTIASAIIFVMGIIAAWLSIGQVKGKKTYSKEN